MNIAGIKRLPATGISVLVAGAGPVGAFTALECWRKGHNVRVIERHPVSATQGDFFTIMPQIVKHIEKYPEMAKKNTSIGLEPWVSYHKINGQLLSGPAPFGAGPQMKNQSDLPRVQSHNRPKFLNMLISQLEEVGVRIEYEKRVVDYNEDENEANVVLDDGNRLGADIVVAADGIGTKSHRLVNGQDIRAWSSGWAIFRTAFSVDAVRDDDELTQRFQVLDNCRPHVEMWHGLTFDARPDAHFSVMRTNDDIMTWFLMHKDAGTAKESWNESVDADKPLEYLAKVAPEFPEYGKRLIRSTPKGDIVDWKLMWRNPQPVTASPLGRVVQVGDAAHTFLPSSGSGANQGIEDGIYLSTCLQLAGKDNIDRATRVYSKLRFERVSCCQKVGFINFQSRNIKDTKAVEKDPSKIKSRHGTWMWKHDPDEYAYENYAKALDHLRNGAPFQNTNIPKGHVYEPWSVDQMMADIEEGKPLKLEGDWS